MNFTDLCFAVIVLILVLTGYARGFLRTIIGPFAFIIATAAAYFYFQKAKNPIFALSIAIMGPIFLGWLTNMILDNTLLRNKLPKISTLSHIGGAIFNALWGGAFFLSILAALIIIPLDTFGLGDVSSNARNSFTYKLVKEPFQSMGIVPPAEAKACVSGACTMSSDKKAELADDADIQNIMNDPRVLKLVSDPAMMAAIEKQDVAAIMTNPVIFELGQDPAFIAKALRAYPKIKAAGDSKTTR
ncbi:MAG: CvpA family protein [Candidatus Omnitrophica bacterium]|nr:CvpA family protein [Candidatus Omnitrophota bacterium]